MNFDSKVHYQSHIEGIYFWNNTSVSIEVRAWDSNAVLSKRVQTNVKFIDNTIVLQRDFPHDSDRISSWLEWRLIFIKGKLDWEDGVDNKSDS